jgi:hypothetical protein
MRKERVGRGWTKRKPLYLKREERRDRTGKTEASRKIAILPAMRY